MLARVAHLSLQFGDTAQQHTHDIEKLFRRAKNKNYAWITGTEAGPGAGNTARELVRVGRESDYRIWVPSFQGNGVERFTDAWIAVRKDLIKGRLERGYEHVIPGSGQMREIMDLPKHKKFAPKGLCWVSFESTNPRLGDVSIGASHYLTEAKDPSSPYWKWNKKLAEEIGKFAKKKGQGHGIVFYGGDQNMQDSRNKQKQGDTFFGQPMTSTWDELKHWENTGHGNIDVIATYDRDGRVEAVKTRALNDRDFFLHGDHFLVEAEIRIKPIKK